ncbi:MAG: cupin domain-containing protein, partial [Gammaproteobacteria bacterium]
SGCGIRFQGDDAIAVSARDFWRTPGDLPHTIEAGDKGMVVIDVFAPPRQEYTRPGAGFGAQEE